MDRERYRPSFFLDIFKFENDTKTSYTIQHKGNGAYIFIIEGSVFIDGPELNKRDAIGIWETENFNIDIIRNAEILIIDVPMN